MPDPDFIDHFEIERATDLTNWTMLNSNWPASQLYYDDTTAPNPTLNYRVTGVTHNNQRFTYNIVSVNRSITIPGALVDGWPRQGLTHFGNGNALGVATDPDGNVIVVGKWNEKINFGDEELNSTFATNVSDAFVCKYSPAGVLLWKRHFGGNGNDGASCVTTDSAGNIYVCGMFEQTVDFGDVGVPHNLTTYGSSDMFVLKLTKDNAFVWVHHYRSIGPQPGMTIDTDASDNLYVGASCFYGADFGGTGQTGGAFVLGTPTGGAGDIDFCVAKLSSSTGLTQWAIRHGGSNWEKIGGLSVGAAGELWVTGYVQGTSTNLDGVHNISVTGDGSTNVFAAKYSTADGSYLWGNIYGTTGGNFGYGISVDRSTGNVVLCGKCGGTINFGSGDFASNGGIYIVGLSPSGTELWHKNSGDTIDGGKACWVSRQPNADGSRILGVCGVARGPLYWGGTQSLFTNGQSNPWMVSFNMSGDAEPSHIWTRYLGENQTGSGIANSLVISAEKMAVAGIMSDTLDFGGRSLTGAGSGFTSTFAVEYNSGQLNQALVERALVHSSTSDYRSATLNAGECDFPHGLVYAAGSLFMVGRVAPAEFVKIDPADFSTRTGFTYAADDLHSYGIDLLYIVSKGKVYALFSNVASTKKLTVSEIDPVTLARANVIRDDDVTVGNGSFACDGTYLYVITNEATSSHLAKYQISDWSRVALVTMTSLPFGHALRFDGTNLYATGAAGTASWIAKINPTNLSYVSAQFPVTMNQSTDDFGFLGDYVYVGFEAATGIIAKVAKADLSITAITTGFPESCYGVQGTANAVWAMFTSGGTLIRIGLDGDVTGYDLAGNASINELQSDGTYLYLTQYKASPAILRLNLPQ